jgi:hypothetical protein
MLHTAHTIPYHTILVVMAGGLMLHSHAERRRGHAAYFPYHTILVMMAGGLILHSPADQQASCCILLKWAGGLMLHT